MSDVSEADSSDGGGWPDQHVHGLILPETQFMTRQTHHAGTARADHLDLRAVSQAQLVKTMHLRRIAQNLPNLGDLSGR
jgi:hypothetical protein